MASKQENSQAILNKLSYFSLAGPHAHELIVFVSFRVGFFMLHLALLCTSVFGSGVGVKRLALIS